MRPIVLPILIVVFWVLMIVGLSSSVGSWSHSQHMILSVLQQINPHWAVNISSEVLDQVNFILRKIAHFSEYAVLFCLTYWLICNKIGVNRAIAIPILLASIVGFAISDEVHQSFVPGRTPQARDVMIDSLGAMTAAGVLLKFDRPSMDDVSDPPEEQA